MRNFQGRSSRVSWNATGGVSAGNGQVKAMTIKKSNNNNNGNGNGNGQEKAMAMEVGRNFFHFLFLNISLVIPDIDQEEPLTHC